MGITTFRGAARRNTWAAGGVAAVAALALAGCGSSSDDNSSAASSPPSPKASASTSASPEGGGNAGTDTAVKSALTATSHARSARMSLQETVRTQGKSQSVSGSGVTTLKDSGAASGAAPAAKGRFSMTAAGQHIEMRVLGTTLYEQLPPGAARQKLSHGKPWVKIDTAKAAASVGDTDAAPDANGQLAYLGNARQVSKVGTESVDGVSTTHYRMTLSPDALKESGAKLTKPVPIDIWVDAQHRVRQQKTSMELAVSSSSASPSTGSSGGTQTVSVTVTMHLSDFGTAVDVTAPPSSQVTDITGQATSTSGGSSA